MKKYLTLRNVVLCCGALLLLVAFFISFAAKLKLTESGQEGYYNNIIWGCNSVTSAGKTEGIGQVQAAPLQLAGLIMIIVGTLGAVVASFVKKPYAKWIVVGLAVVTLAGSIFQFFAIEGFARALANTAAAEDGITDKAQIEIVYQLCLSELRAGNASAVVSTLMGIFGIVGSLGVCASPFLPEKKLFD